MSEKKRKGWKIAKIAKSVRIRKKCEISEIMHFFTNFAKKCKMC